MGCDIHTRVEYLDRNGNWVCGDFFRVNPYYRGDSPSESDPYSVVGLCDERDYSLFAVLANVRNYGDTDYIDEPRGIPEDACARTRNDYAVWGDDAHSASWFTLKELMEWNETAPPFREAGFVSPEDAAKLDAGAGTPSCWCQWTSQKSWVHREWVADKKPLDRLIRELIRRGDDLWLWFDEEQARERADKLRFVFWFDN